MLTEKDAVQSVADRRRVVKGRIGPVASAIALLWLGSGTIAFGHSPLDETIAQVTRDLSARPLDADLWARRAELHRVHGDFEAAEADLDRAAELAPELIELDFYRGRLLLDRERFGPAEEVFARFLRRAPDHVAAHSLRAEALLRLGQPRKAADAYARALRIRPSAGLYLARARTLAGAGESKEALATLDRAAETLGPVPSLELYAIDLELAERRFDAALARLDRLHAGAARKDDWLVGRADILERAGRTNEARTSYREALAVVAELPPSRRRAPATQALEARARDGLARLASGHP
jgi:tetratricopeptide (TPR) repeat protein